jgi:hypothetical protein
MGRISHQVKPHREVTSPKIVPGAVPLSAKNAREPKTTLGRQEEMHGSPNQPLRTNLL